MRQVTQPGAARLHPIHVTIIRQKIAGVQAERHLIGDFFPALTCLYTGDLEPRCVHVSRWRQAQEIMLEPKVARCAVPSLLVSSPIIHGDT